MIIATNQAIFFEIQKTFLIIGFIPTNKPIVYSYKQANCLTRGVALLSADKTRTFYNSFICSDEGLPRNVNFRNSLHWPIHVISSVD